MDYEDVKRIRENPTAEMDTCDIYELQRLISEAIEKQIPKKPKIINKHEAYCPKCWDNKRYFPVDNKYFSVNLNPEHEKEIRRITYCKHCGQRIDWSECGARTKGADDE